MITSLLLATAIELSGVIGDDLRARTFFDANNVKVGDPLVLTIDFLGNADFVSLHPPKLAKAVNRKDWKLDDASAKTDTFRDARRLTYRVRPMHPGVLWFPALEFEYTTAAGEKRLVRSNAVPVHAKAGLQVAVAEIADDPNEFPQPTPLITTPPPGLSADASFAWRKACAKPTADSFAEFDTPEARLNEAGCAIREGNWARALRIYSLLEWRTGQTPEIERGLKAALALKYDNPAVEIPVWRIALRPALKYPWCGRLGIAAGAIAALFLIFWLLGRAIRLIACLSFMLLTPVHAQGIFDQFDRIHQQMQRQMQQMSANFGFGFNDEEAAETPIGFRVTAKPDRDNIHVGEPFGIVFSIEMPRNVQLEPLRIAPSVPFGLRYSGQAENLTDETAENPSNVIKRLRVPVRYDVPIKTPLAFTLDIPYSRRIESRRRSFSFSSFVQRSEQVTTTPFQLEIKPPPDADQPVDYAGIVSEGLFLAELPDILRVETNDVVKITYRLRVKGHVPPAYLPPDVAYEWTRSEDEQNGIVQLEYVRYLVADGTPATPRLSVSYYDPRTKQYSRVTTGGTALKYIQEK